MLTFHQHRKKTQKKQSNIENEPNNICRESTDKSPPNKYPKSKEKTFIILGDSHNVHCGINPPQKHPPPFFLANPFLTSANCPRPLF